MMLQWKERYREQRSWRILRLRLEPPQFSRTPPAHGASSELSDSEATKHLSSQWVTGPSYGARRRALEAAALSGWVIAVKGKKGEADRLAKLAYLGPAAGLKAFEAAYGDGSTGRFSYALWQLDTLAEVKRRLMPEGAEVDW